MSVNKVILVGHLGADPEMKFTQGGQPVCSFRLATNEVWTDKSGQRQEQTEWHSIVVWGKTAELCNQYLSKGRQAYLEGKIKTRQWQDKEGQTRYTTEIVADVVRFLGGGADGPSTPKTGAKPAAAPSNQGSFSDDDIPF